MKRLAASMLVGSACVLLAQDSADLPTFEVASIRRNTSTDLRGAGLAGPQPGGRFVAIGTSLRGLVSGVYGMEVLGGPAWVDTDRFDIEARASGNPPPAAFVPMMRALLADRFSLVVHTETREAPVFALRLTRDDGALGPRMRETDAACASIAREAFPDAPSAQPGCGDFRLGAATLNARAMTMPNFARLLSGRAGRPVIDDTGLDGSYDLQLDWSSDLGLVQAPPDAAGADTLTPDGLSLFTAMQEQLGLRLDATRGEVDVLVIDRVEPPTPN
jgi:uncharacterized protein (TIGR03435 family)